MQIDSLSKCVLVMALTLMLGSALIPAGAQNPRRVRQPWEDLESDLRQQGFKTDSSSLVKLAETGPSEQVQWMAIEILGLRGDQEARPVLRKLAESSRSEFLKAATALALARLKDERGIPLLKELLRDTSDKERQLYMASQLAALNDPSGYAFVVKASESKDSHLRYLSAAALIPFVRFEQGQKTPGIDPIEKLLRLAGDQDPKNRNEAVRQFALAVYQGASISRFRPEVEKMTKNDPDSEVRATSANILTLWNEQCRTHPSKEGCK
jgi:HEAT repeat protein